MKTAVATLRQNSGWYAMNMAILLAIVGYAAFVVFEHSRADTQVGLTVVSNGISMSCTSDVVLGTIAGTGDTGPYDDDFATSCTVVTGNALGYNLHWQVVTGSGGTSTGRLISENEDVIEPYEPAVIGTPETWNVAAGSGAWGGRLSSASTTVDTVVWGTDGGDSTEKWLDVSTGGLVIANRGSQTTISGDVQKIGFRVEIGSSVTQPDGTYEATVVFTATTN
jgi:hypothetical protein